jgi:hypothetical protein
MSFPEQTESRQLYNSMAARVKPELGLAPGKTLHNGINAYVDFLCDK